MASRSPPSFRRFLAIFVAATLSFIGDSAYSQSIQRRINKYAQEIARGASPSIEDLSAARTELHHLAVLLTRGTTHAQADLDAVARSRAQIRQTVEAYYTRPTFPNERALWHDMEASLAALDQVVDAVVARWRASDLARADAIVRQELPQVVDQANDAFTNSVDFNADEARSLAESIESIRERALLIEAVLDALSGALALGTAFYLVRAARQYTALAEAHQRLAEQRAEELEQFAGRVAHDILSPLSATAMALGLASRGLPDDAKAQGAIAHGKRSLARVKRIVDGLLEFARAGAQPAEDARADVAQVIDDVVSDVSVAAEEAGIEVTVAPFTPTWVKASPGVLTSVLANLLRNAVKYMGDAPERRIDVRVREQGATVRFEVADTGPGIPASLLDAIFEPYVRAAPSTAPGIGLGLATVKRVVETHGGRVGVQSAAGAGALFWFELPTAAPPDPLAS